MYFVILDSTANLVESFDNEDEAVAALTQIVHDDPDSADEYALLQYESNGEVVGDALLGSDLGVAA